MIPKTIRITGSKSESNRLLILQKLAQNSFQIHNLSNAKDTQVLQMALANTDSQVINIGLAGTAMRFLTAYYALQSNKETLLTGEGRMLERPIAQLVDALKSLGCEINYKGKISYPPILIKGKKINQSNVSIPATISSQYITALMLIAPFTEKGLNIKLEGKITSIPYIKMTLALLQDLGIEAQFRENTILIPHASIIPKTQVVESDWSSASYYYSYVALSRKEIILESYKENSLQGDRKIVEIYENLGVKSRFLPKNQLHIAPITPYNLPSHLELNLNDTPDIAQTIAVTCLGLKITADLYGLETLKIKETDRLQAMKNELEKFGASVKITANSLHINAYTPPKQPEKIHLQTYHDHRMAMAFAPLLINHPFLIENPTVVEKSYPDFWQDFTLLGINLSQY